MASGTNAVVCPPEVRRSSFLQLNHKARGIPNRKRIYELTNLLNFANPPNNPTLSFLLRRNPFQLRYPQTSTPPHIGGLSAADTNNAPTTMDHDQSVQYLEGLLGRTLRIHTTDTRMFVGLFKCTDAVSSHLGTTCYGGWNSISRMVLIKNSLIGPKYHPRQLL